MGLPKGNIPWNKGKKLGTYEEMFGEKRAIQRKENHRELMLGRKNPFYGKHHDINTRRRMSKSHQGVPHPHSEIQDIRISLSRMGKKHHFYGKNLSEEHRNKISKALKGYKRPLSCRKNYAKSKIGKKNPMYGKIPAMRISKGGFTLKGDYVRSSWEIQVCNWLYQNHIKYQYEPKTFILKDSTGKEFSYTPDLYIKDWKVWCEIKGWWNPESFKKVHLFEKKYGPMLLVDIKNLHWFEEV